MAIKPTSAHALMIAAQSTAASSWPVTFSSPFIIAFTSALQMSRNPRAVIPCTNVPLSHDVNVRDSPEMIPITSCRPLVPVKTPSGRPSAPRNKHRIQVDNPVSLVKEVAGDLEIPQYNGTLKPAPLTLGAAPTGFRIFVCVQHTWVTVPGAEACNRAHWRDDSERP